ncbi:MULTISPECIES: aspartyl protease family protein [unclassified Mucilaginibacter]|uniref:aspartyl protease family protein n=1 Tax=unclassified Mucilaginibacter TaxID=2617802 RepID=UPI002AC953D4|nr:MULTISPECIES: aspartyl protease family protein [unclassified Mucilaginibacter]MEB0262971.1 aspartyl protease family protein [Mucilaginibacter sp. 10I4]MEB0277534.1 aspartyl protease family protein [Mucilaginibacter sp. 10B2]MEB0299449.1 aspartyl protease family protein [Mucilaginibacter sp. 5C4]WPX24836.1 aspartyl protease family protein [Mucilaginibacter sp. 5C4]
MTKTTISVPLNIIDLQGDGFHPLLDIVIFGKPFKVVLDTGASRTAFDRDLLIEANEQAAIVASERLSTGLGTNTMESATAVIENIWIGDLLIPELEVAVLNLSTINIAYHEMGHPEVLGVLGSDILMKYKAVVDFGKKRLLLK